MLELSRIPSLNLSTPLTPKTSSTSTSCILGALFADWWDLGGGDFCWNSYCYSLGIPALYFTMRKGVLIDWWLESFWTVGIEGAGEAVPGHAELWRYQQRDLGGGHFGS